MTRSGVKMWCVHLFVIIYVNGYVYGSENEYNIVKWTVTGQEYAAASFDLPTTRVILDNNKQLKIILENYNISSYYFSCWGPKSNFEIKHSLLKDDLIIIVKKVRADMSTSWTCKMWKIDHYQHFTFRIRIKAQERLKVTVGRSELKYVSTDLSEEDYDGTAVYWYTDGEVIDLVCQRYFGSKLDGKIHLNYYNRIGAALFETNKIEAKHQLSVRKMMSYDNHGDYLYCSYISPEKIVYTYKTLFQMNSTVYSQNPLKITINDRVLVAGNPNNLIEQYQYKFYQDEILTISCEMNDILFNGSVTLFFDDYELNKNLVTDTNTNEDLLRQTIRILKTQKKFDTKGLWCITEYNSTKYSIELLLLLDQIEPVVLGLPEEDIMQQYSSNLESWVIDYTYSVDQELNLTCLGGTNTKYRWILRNSSVETPIEEIRTNNHYWVTLVKEYNGTSIICDSKQRKIIINLYPKSLEAFDYFFYGDGGFIIVIACLVAFSAVAVTTICLIIWCRSHSSKGNYQESCENLTHSLETPIPAYPSQWQDGTADYSNVHDTSMIRNSIYAVDNTPVYARPHKTKKPSQPTHQTIGPIYQQPVNKFNANLVDNDPVDNYVNSVRRSVNLSVNNVNNDGESSRLCDDKDTYDYVLNFGDSSEQTEPLYCEVSGTQ